MQPALTQILARASIKRAGENNSLVDQFLNQTFARADDFFMVKTFLWVLLLFE